MIDQCPSRWKESDKVLPHGLGVYIFSDKRLKGLCFLLPFPTSDEHPKQDGWTLSFRFCVLSSVCLPHNIKSIDDIESKNSN